VKFKWLTGLSILLFAVPLYFFILWIYCFEQAETQTARKNLFDSMVPEFLNGRYHTVYMGLFCGICAIVISSFVVTQSVKVWRVINILVVIFSLILVGINLMSLM